MIDNVVELDSFSKQYANGLFKLAPGAITMALMSGCFTIELLKHIPIELLPILVFYDFAAAFPSVSEEFLMLVLENVDVQEG